MPLSLTMLWLLFWLIVSSLWNLKSLNYITTCNFEKIQTLTTILCSSLHHNLNIFKVGLSCDHAIFNFRYPWWCDHWLEDFFTTFIAVKNIDFINQITHSITKLIITKPYREVRFLIPHCCNQLSSPALSDKCYDLWW